jgi:hypothetical protein
VPALLEGITQIYATKGKQVVHLDLLKDKPGADTIRSVLIGPTGNLRAPTLRKGKTLIVGFDDATYRTLFG